ncbi:MAG TPA: MgtC/SapB family protein [Steroidobacteraceae bacterium]|nr:MgtC/SapB family protein [Steroidobacteraceae bacterium]
MLPEFDLAVVWNFATALLIGALIGIERERNKREHGDVAIGGIRTFILFALFGALGGWLSHVLQSPWILAAGLLAAMAPVVAGYVISARLRPAAVALTTELAAIAAFLLGAMSTLGQRELAVGLGVAVAAVLAYKQPLHGIALRLDRDDIYAGLRLLIATFIVLPLLPDRALDPWAVLNPRVLWMLVLLISSLSLVGYVATRLLGAGDGIPLTGITGGLVSSTAVTLEFSRQSRLPAFVGAASALASGIVLSWAVMFVRVLFMVLVVNRTLLGPLLPPFAAMAAASALLGWYFHSRATENPSPEGVPLENPFSLTAAAKFAVFFALVLLVVQFAKVYSSDAGLYAVSALAGTTDVDAITLSMAQFARTADPGVAVRAITIATLVNTAVKTGMAVTLGSPELRRSMLLAAPIIVGAGALVLVLVLA